MKIRYQEAWNVGNLLNDSREWINAANVALNNFNIDFAIRVFRRLGDIAMVWSLEEIRHVEDLHLLSGHIHMLLGNLTKAKVRRSNKLLCSISLEIVLCRIVT